MHEFIAKDGNKYFIDLDDSQDITVFNSNKDNMGGICLLYIDNGCYKMNSCYYVTGLDLKNCKRIGIGTEIFRLHKEVFREPITAASVHGPKMDDGSHLIDDGVPFIQKMRELGLVSPERDGRFDE